jgi:hypothetical protein
MELTLSATPLCRAPYRTLQNNSGVSSERSALMFTFDLSGVFHCVNIFLSPCNLWHPSAMRTPVALCPRVSGEQHHDAVASTHEP